MDLRERKTKRAIKDAFLQLRVKKPLERIRVKELSELAQISKATFYLHYKDIYDLSEQLRNEVVQDIMGAVALNGTAPLDMEKMAKLIKEISVPEQITGYEYEVEACDRAIAAGLTECPEMPHAETLEIMRQMDKIKK